MYTNEKLVNDFIQACQNELTYKVALFSCFSAQLHVVYCLDCFI